MSAMADQLRETYQDKETDELVELAGKTTLTDTAYEVLDEILVSRGVNIDSVKALRAQNADMEKREEEKQDRLASIPRRFVAKVIDTWGIVLVIALLASMLRVISPEFAKAIYGILIVPWFVYFFFKDGLDGQSIGKRTMKIRVVHYDTKRPCSFGQSFWRNLAGIFVFDWLFALGKRRMRLGDMIASTEVVNAK
jgi:uncharacterized RDD family membrane protein YckC